MTHVANIINWGSKNCAACGMTRSWPFILASFSIMIYSLRRRRLESLHNAHRHRRRGPVATVGSASSALLWPLFQTTQVISMDEIDPGLKSGTTFVLNIPPDFQRDVLAGKHPALRVNIDATRMTQAFIGAELHLKHCQTEITGVAQRHRTRTVLPITLATRVKFNPNLNGIWFRRRDGDHQPGDHAVDHPDRRRPDS